MVPTRYGRQAILDEFGGLKTFSMSASIDSNRVVDCKVDCSVVYLELAAELCLDCVLYITQVRRSLIHVEAFHHTQSILLYGQAARAISIG